MGRTDKHIDRLFRSELEDLEVRPPLQVWDKIQAGLHQQRKKRHLFTVKMAASVALLIATSVIFYYLINISYEKRNLTNIETVNEGEDKNLTLKDRDLSKSSQDKQPGSNSIRKINNNKPHDVRDRTFSADIQPKGIAQVVDEGSGTPLLQQKNKPAASHETEKKNGAPELDSSRQAELSTQNNIKGLLALNNVDQGLKSRAVRKGDHQTEDKQRNSYWSITGSYGTVYTDRLITSNQMEPYEEATMNDAESGLNSFGGGIGLRYHIHRWSFETGLYYSKFGQENQQVFMESTSYNRSYYSAINNEEKAMVKSSYYINNSLGVISYDSPYERISSLNVSYDRNTPNSNFSDGKLTGRNTIDDANTGIYDDQSNLLQFVHFVEIPFTVRYTAIKRKQMDVNVIGGIEGNFVAGSQVFFESTGDEKSIGNIANINEFNASALFGVGIGYAINPYITFHVEPTFKLFLNSLNHDLPINFYPYQIGVFTGISYAF